MDKYRYVYRRITDGKIRFNYYLLEEIEKGEHTDFMNESKNQYELISRDKFTHSYDYHFNEVYENDIIQGPTKEVIFIVKWIVKENSWNYKPFYREFHQVKNQIYFN